MNIPEIPEWDEGVTKAIDRALEMAEKFPSWFIDDPATVRKMIERADLFEKKIASSLAQIEGVEKLIAERRETYKSIILKLATLREKLNGRAPANWPN